MSLKNRILETPLYYSLWSGLLNRRKIRAIKNLMPGNKQLCVLDLGCGPGSNAHLFTNCSYTGIDINEHYVTHSRSRHPQFVFLVQDITKLELPSKVFNLILINSLLHHLKNEEIGHLLLQIDANILGPNGRIIISEPLTAHRGRFLHLILERMDRGNYFRTYDEYLKLFEPYFVLEKEEIYPLKLFGFTGWQMLAMRFVRK